MGRSSNIGDEDIALNKQLKKICSDCTLQSQKEGFFNEWSEKVNTLLTKDFWPEFQAAKTDSDRIKCLWKQECVHSLNIQPFYTGKNIAISKNRREHGNAAFQSKKNREALAIYTQAIVRAPPSGDHISLALANRSAVLFHLGEFKQCMEDISTALETEYPKRLYYKVLERRGQCLVELRNFVDAEEVFHLAVVATSHSDLDSSKRDLWLCEIEKSLKKCRDQIDKKQIEDGQKHTSASRDFEDDDHLFNGTSLIIPNASSTLTVESSKDAGRYVVANENIPTGKSILRESPFASVLMPEQRGQFCEHCFIRLIAPIPCKLCSSVVFCSRKCRDAADKSYHRWECPYLDLFIASGMSLNCSLSLRIVTEKGLNYFKKVWPKINRGTKVPSTSKPHIAGDYENIYNLEALENQRDQQDFLQRTLMALFLLMTLRSSDFFGHCRIEISDLNEDEILIGSLLLRHLQVIQFNAHEVSGIAFDQEISYKDCKSIHLGLAVYPTVAFFNHSCYPTVARYFNGKEMTIVTIRPIKRGEMIPENYGPIFTHEILQVRQRKLLSRYWFRCTCEACLNDWPLYAKMTNNITVKPVSEINQLKQDKTRNKAEDSNQIVNYISEMDTLGKIKDVHKAYDEGLTLMSENKRDEAVVSFSRWIDEASPYIQLPLKDFHLAMQSLRLLTGARGSYYITKS